MLSLSLGFSVNVQHLRTLHATKPTVVSEFMWILGKTLVILNGTQNSVDRFQPMLTQIASAVSSYGDLAQRKVDY